MECPNVKKVWLKIMAADDSRFYYIIPVYYKDETGKLIGIQATFSKRHAKTVSKYSDFYQQIATSPEKNKLYLYYLILPHWVKHFSKMSYPDSQFWAGFQSEIKRGGKRVKRSEPGIGSKWKDNITFFALLPPDSFNATYADEH